MNKIVKSLMLLAALLSFGSVNARGIYALNNQINMNTNKEVARKIYKVKHVKFAAASPTFLQINKKFESEKIESAAVDVVNWPKANGDYKPVASFKIMYTDTDIYIQYNVKEKALKAVFDKDEGAQPWTDDCMEFFIKPSDNLEDSLYFNLEMNCIGHGLLGMGEGRKDRHNAQPEVMKMIRRFSTLGDSAFGIKEIEKENALASNRVKDNDVCITGDKLDEYEWTMVIVLPIKLICEDGVKALKGKKVMGNVYKCGDKMPQAHYLTWNPIGTPKPDYHRPEYFGYFKFEK
jgi:hypothetical protein